MLVVPAAVVDGARVGCDHWCMGRFAALALCVLLAAPAGAATGHLHSDGAWIRDGRGRVILLRGLNYSGLEFGNVIGRPNGPAAEDFAQMASWGVNVVRLAIAWHYLEPQPGVFDLQFLRDNVDPIVKWARTVYDKSRLAEYVHHASHVARSGRPGPVVLVLPGDLMAAEVDEVRDVDRPITQPVPPEPAPEAIEHAATYRGKPLPAGQKSVTLTLVFRKPEGTLTREEADAAVTRVVHEASAKLGATLRA